MFDENLKNFFFRCWLYYSLGSILGVLNTEKNPLECLNVNILGTKAVLEVVKKTR